MSDSNIGVRKGKGVRNQLFMLTGILQEFLNNKKAKPIDIQISDFRQCFDSLWLEECMNDLYDAGIVDDNLALIYGCQQTCNCSKQ